MASARRGHRLRKCEAVGTDDPLAVDRRHRCGSHPGLVGFLFRDKLRSAAKLPSAGAKPEVALAILPFRNASQDPSLDWYGATLADMLSSDVGQSAHLRMVSPDRLHQVLHDLRIGADTVVDPTILRRVGDSSNADTVIWGQYAKFGDQIRIDANIQNLTSGKTTSLKAETSEKGLPAAIDTLADSIRKNLALSSRPGQGTASSVVQAVDDVSGGAARLHAGRGVHAAGQDAGGDQAAAIGHWAGRTIRAGVFEAERGAVGVGL